VIESGGSGLLDAPLNHAPLPIDQFENADRTKLRIRGPLVLAGIAVEPNVFDGRISGAAYWLDDEPKTWGK
jgi:hypothetical protein